MIEPFDLGCTTPQETGPESVYSGLTLREAREQMEKEMIISAIERQEGNIMKAAEELGVSRPTLYDLMKKYALQHP